MEIHVNYQPTAKELMKASSLFVEKKPFFLLIIRAMNVFATIIVLLMIVKVTQFGITPEETMAGMTALLWLFARRPLNEWLLTQRLKKSKILDVPINVTLSLNGITWAGKGLAPGNMPWEHIRYVFEAKNGIIIPNAATRFLWLPFRGFKSPQQITELQQLFDDKKIIRRKYPKWEC